MVGQVWAPLHKCSRHARIRGVRGVRDDQWRPPVSSALPSHMVLLKIWS